jgi:acyl transferase domain-containing protein/thioesterase domain-containing protein/NAD(P)-dependent dehydrogenase (short-subunit alcohol dehydrogenase family)/acyl carrier protein
MSDLAARVAGLSPVQRKLLEQRLKSQQPAAEPIAIIGMSCRFPGAPDLRSFWRLIEEGRSAASEVPADRWNADAFFDASGEAPGKMSVRWAAFIDNPDQFDPQFFGITPREAVRMDPQQRLLLEVAWEAMENAGRPAEDFAGTRTGVFVGIGGNDYSKVCIGQDDYYERIDAHLGTGNALSIAANRVSYVFDLHGPSAAVDTACSSSSLAIHFAVESLRRGESDAALAGGANLILTPETTIAFSKARMLSPEGMCRPFDSRANGYVRGEGCGLVLLKRLSDAERDGDDILAVLRATSVNQDGRTSGISAPNSQSQIACIRDAMKQARLTPDDIDYIEAHGTGTPLGDPIEMMALAQIFGTTDAAARPVYVSSVKANVGHMETVSGVAGLIKVVLMMQHDEIAPQTHFESLNPHINLADTRLVIPTEHLKWPRSKRRRVAGVSSFGFGGTNTHMIVESAGELAATLEQNGSPTSADASDRPLHLLKLSAKSEAALKQQAAQLVEQLEHDADPALADICWSANTSWSDFNYRAVVTATDIEQLRQRLNSFVGEAATAAGIKQATVRSIGRPNVAFLFTGQGAQYVGMGHGLYESQPVFRAALDKCDAILRDYWGGESLLKILYPSASAKADDRLHQTKYTQPALFALEYALAALWASWGVKPDIVLGHSVGEYAAACVAGVMSLEDGLKLIAERARLMQSVKRHGKMAVVFASRERVAKEIEIAGGDVVIAVLNGPENIVVSGEAAAVERLVAKFESDGIQVKLLNVSHAFHSPLMDEMLDEFEKLAAGIGYHVPQVPLAANLTGQLMNDAPTAHYWRDHLRNTVQFSEGMTRIAEAQPAIIIEIGPSASLLGMGRRCEPKLETAWLPSLREGQEDWSVVAGSVAEYYVRGGRIDWRGWDRPWHRHRVQVPNYPFQRSRHWFTIDPSQRLACGGRASFSNAAGAGGRPVHPLLGPPLSTVWANKLFESRLTMRSPAYLADHQVQGSAVTPAAAYIEQGLAAAADAFGPGQHGLANLTIQQAMFLPEGLRRRVQVAISPESGGEAVFETYSRTEDENGAATAWSMHATGMLVHESKLSGAAPETNLIDLAAARDRAVTIMGREEFYESMAERGLAYGPAFQMLSELYRGVDDAVASVQLPESIVGEAAGYHLHPVLGDALLQTIAGAIPLEEDGSFSPFTYMPVGVRSVRVLRTIEDFTQPLFAYARRTSNDSTPSPERVEADVYLVAASGEILAAAEGAQVQRLGRSGAAGSTTDSSRWLYEIAWREEPLAVEPISSNAPPTEKAGDKWLIFADSKGVARKLADQLAAGGKSCVLVEPAKEFASLLIKPANGHPGRQGVAKIDPLDESHYRRLLDEIFVTTKQTCAGIAHLWSLDIDSNEPSRNSALGCGGALQLTRALSRTTFSKLPQLWLVTAGAQAVVAADVANPPAVTVEQSPLVGFGRVAALELPDFRPHLVDLDAINSGSLQDEAAVSLAAELQNKSVEGEVAYRAGKRFVARLVRSSASDSEHAKSESAHLSIPRGPFQLRVTQSGSFDALQFVPVEREAPANGQVEIEVRATGLNFSDVLKALGLYPGIKDAIVPLGIEASGVVTAVGGGVTRFKVGDEVLGVVPYAFASHARTADYALVHKPKSIEHDAACTIPITFLTAYYGLVRLAQLQPGERVLIHAGAGGVGLAAIQIAQQIGAEIYATAGSETKRDFLRSLGVEHVYSSRSVAFAEEILADTDRQGVDVVLNSLPGEAITKSLAILRAYGRFLEIGKTDIYQNRMIGLLPFQDNLSYSAIDLDRMLRQRPDYIRDLFAETMQHFEAGHYEPLIFTRFEGESTIDAFRYMSQRKNIGKVVVSIGSRDSRVEGREPEIQASPKALVRSDGNYLITGGLGALGLRVARWLADQGAGTVALLSRRAPSSEIEHALNAIRGMGTNVVVLRGDVADADSLQTALTQLPPECPPLRGVVHAAGVLADGIVTEMTLDQLDRALAPKVRGARNLHLATRDLPLDFFVMFSSVASVLGSPGQANYAAGNAYLDTLAHARRAAGLPATAINWGPWAGSGMAVDAGLDEAKQPRGMSLIEPEIGLDLLGKLMKSGAPQVTVMNAQWAEMLKLLGSRRPALLAEIAAEVQESDGDVGTSRVDHAFRQRLLAADDANCIVMVQDYIRQELARIMGIEPASLEIDQPLSTFGLDSLLALELKNNLEGRLDFTLPMAKLMEGPSIASLAAETSRLLTDGAGGSTDGSTETTSSATAAEWTPLLPLRETGNRPPLILLPALGGDARYYLELVQQLGDDQPAYVFRPRGVDQDLPPHLTITEMIADYLAALRDLQPVGPYYLAGWSTGGAFAFALAEALERAGEDVGMLALMDSPLPSLCDDVDVEDDARFLCDLVNFANRCAGEEVRIDYEKIARLPASERFAAALADARDTGLVPREMPEEFIRQLVHVGEANVRVLQSYRPTPLSNPVQFFAPETREALAEISGRTPPDDDDLGWSRLVGQTVELHRVPGDHFSMMMAQSAALIARELAQHLNYMSNVSSSTQPAAK